MEKILKVTYPPITAYMTHAPILSIIADSEEYKPWFLLNYIQVRINKDGGIDFYNFCNSEYVCPYLEVNSLNREIVGGFISADINDLFIKWLDDGYYIIPIIDTYYISIYYNNYNKESGAHPLFIYGYDSQEKIFYAADFFQDGKYSFMKVPFNELSNAYYNCNEDDFWMKGVKLIRRKKHTYDYEMKDFKNVLERYLTGCEPSITYNQHTDFPRRFGINELCKCVKMHIANFCESKTCDPRALPIFCDHKKVLLMAIEFLINEGQHQLECLKQEYITLYKHSITFRNKCIKYAIAGKINSFEYALIDDIKKYELEIISNTIKLISD